MRKFSRLPKKGETSNSTLLTNLTPKRGKQDANRIENSKQIKSLSDTTIYVSALTKSIENLAVQKSHNNYQQRLINAGQEPTIGDGNDYNRQISNFVDDARRIFDNNEDKRVVLDEDRDQAAKTARRSSVVVVPGKEDAQS